MKFLIAHLSDIHIVADTSKNPILNRAEQIVRAISSTCTMFTKCAVVVSGDLAFSGQENEYLLVNQFLETVRSEMLRLCPGKPLEFVFVPGNHDCQLLPEDSVRTALLANKTTSNINDDKIVLACAGVQKNFFAATGTLAGKGHPSTALEVLYGRRELDVDGRKVVFQTFNSAWDSMLKEAPGTLQMPIPLLKSGLEQPADADLSISVFHHPYNWFELNNGKLFRTLIETSSDIILTGHEHDSRSFRRTAGVGEQNEYLEGAALQDSSDPESSSFHVIQITDEDSASYRVHVFSWNSQQKRYLELTSPVVRQFERNKSRLRHAFDVTNSYAEFLSNPGANFTHPRRSELTLKDIFVYPDLQPFDLKGGQRAAHVVHRDVLSYVMAQPKLLILGRHQAGKSAFARMLHADLRRQGRIPLLIRGDVLTTASEHKLRSILNHAIEAQYGNDAIQRFWQLDKESRVLLIDDVHRIKVARKEKDALYDLLIASFGTVTAFGSNDLRFAELLQPGDDGRALWLFKVCDIEEMGHELRSTLIDKWHTLGSGAYTSNEAFQSACIATERIVSEVIGEQLFPPFPVYILIILQQLEQNTPSASIKGSIGYLYEVLITSSLRDFDSNDASLDTLYTYLSELAFMFYNRKETGVTDLEVESWHHKHCDTFYLSLDYKTLRNGLAAANILDISDDVVRFNYPYMLSFFVARYFRDHIGEDEVRKQIGILSKQLYHELSAEIIMFLCHHSKDTFILETILSVARDFFVDYRPCDLKADTRFLSHLDEKNMPLQITAAHPEDQRRLHLVQLDAERRSKDDPQPKLRVFEIDAVERISDAARVNAALKTIQILGQILRNFSGSLKGNEQVQLAEETFNLGLRTISFFFEGVQKNNNAVINLFTSILETKTQKHTPREMLQLARGAIVWLVEICTFGMLKHISDSIGSESLARTLNEVAKKNGGMSHRLIDLSIRLDHFSAFPEKQILDLAKDLRKDSFTLSILKRLVWRHFTVFLRGYKLRQKTLALFEIPIETPGMMRHQKNPSVPAKRK